VFLPLNGKDARMSEGRVSRDEPFVLAGVAPVPNNLFLATQVQVERHAVQLLQRPDVREAVKSESARWRNGTPGFLDETYAQIDASIEEVALLVALQVVNGDALRPRVVEISVGPHHWGGFDVPGGRWGINNPDTLYFAIPIVEGERYVVRGRRHATGPIDVNFSIQTPDVWGTLDNIGRRDLRIEPDGIYRIDIGDAPENGQSNQLQIKPGGTVLLIRQTLADWTVKPDVLTVERIGGKPAGPVASDDDLARELIVRLATVITHNLETLQSPVLRLSVNTIPQPAEPGHKPGYLITQRNTLGHFRLEDDEALVAVFTPGGAGYAAFTATNIWGITPDAARYQNSLNTHQADINPDGTITFVVANRDPGIFNWIDPGGNREGILMLRWQLLDEYRAEAGPGIDVRKVLHDALRSILPQTIRRVSETERQHQIAARAAAYERRFLDR